MIKYNNVKKEAFIRYSLPLILEKVKSKISFYNKYNIPCEELIEEYDELVSEMDIDKKIILADNIMVKVGGFLNESRTN
ncbi:MAG: hypothetical protein ACRC28_17370 [Clostridium sp.]|uniref:hypothetical protein n=1 Tax=Clostridium sp. TaxID=1506 RepID=UPI003F3EC0EB